MRKRKIISFVVIIMLFGFVTFKYDKTKRAYTLYEYELTEEEQARRNDFVLFRYRDDDFIPIYYISDSSWTDDTLIVPYSARVSNVADINYDVENGDLESYGPVRQSGEFSVKLAEINYTHIFEGEGRLSSLGERYSPDGESTINYPHKKMLWWSGTPMDTVHKISDIHDYYIVEYEGFFVMLDLDTIISTDYFEKHRFFPALICDYSGECGYGIDSSRYETGLEEKYQSTQLSLKNEMQPRAYYDTRDQKMYVFYKQGNGIFMHAFD